jgi:hypothetical protein
MVVRTEEEKKQKKPRRPKGTGSIYQRSDSPVWWIRYSRNGKPYRESSKSTKRTDAATLLKVRMSEIVTGTFAGPKTERVLVNELHDDYIRDLRIKGRMMLPKMISNWNLHLKPVFGGMRAIDVTTDHITRYVDDRQREKTRTGKKVANATICRELEALKRMFKIGYQVTPPKVQRIPTFPGLVADNVRTGLLHVADFSGTNGDSEVRKSTLWTPYWERVLRLGFRPNKSLDWASSPANQR